MKTIVESAWDEGRRIFLDGGVLLITAIATIIYSFFYPVPYVPEVLHDMPVAVVDDDGSSMSRALVRMIDAHEAVRVASRCASIADAAAQLERGEVFAIVSLPKGLERDVLRGRRVRVSAHIDSTYMLAYSGVLKGLMESSGTLSAGIELARWRAAGKTADAALAARQPVGMDLRPMFSPASGYGTYVVPAVMILVLQQTLLIGAGIVGGSRRESLERSASEQAPTDPIGAPVLAVIGRAVPYVLLYGLNAAYCLGFVLPYQGFPVRGDWQTVTMLTVPFLLATTMMALALRGLFRRRETAIQVLLFTSLPMIFLAGFSWPSEAVPAWLRFTAQLVPTTSAIPAFLRVTRMGASLADVSVETTVLWVLALLYFPLACWAESGVYTAKRWRMTSSTFGLGAFRTRSRS